MKPISVSDANFQVEVLTSNLDDVLRDPDIDLVVIATRHHEHADQVARSLEAGKHVFVEKPLALSWSELDRISAVLALEPNLPQLPAESPRPGPVITFDHVQFSYPGGAQVLRDASFSLEPGKIPPAARSAIRPHRR